MADEIGITFFVLAVSGVLLLFGWAGWNIGTAVGRMIHDITYRR